MFVPIYFQVWPIFRPQINIFVELLSILRFWPLQMAYFDSCTLFVLSLRLNLKELDIKECLKCFITCLYQLVFKFGKFLDFKFIYLLNYWWFCDFDPSKWHFLALMRYFSLFEANLKKLIIKECLNSNIKCLYTNLFSGLAKF